MDCSKAISIARSANFVKKSIHLSTDKYMLFSAKEQYNGA
jgi:hypothetical protein